MSGIEKAFQKLSGPKMIVGLILTTIGLTVATISWFNTSFVSKQIYDIQIKQYEQQRADDKKDFDIIVNRIRKEVKQVRIDELLFKQKLLLAKGEANFTDFDRTTLELIKLELQTLNVTPQ